MQKKDIKFRVAFELDLMQLLSLGKEYASEAERWFGLKFDPVRCVKYAAIAVSDKDQQIFLAMDGTKIVGFVWVAIQGQVWTPDPVCKDLFAYVLPEYRNYHVGSGLIREAEKWARACGALAFHTGANSGIKGDSGAAAMYRHLGFRDGGFNFMKDLTEVDNG